MDEGESQNSFPFCIMNFPGTNYTQMAFAYKEMLGYLYVVEVHCIQQLGFASCNKLRLRGLLNITSWERTLLNTNICL